MNSMINLREPKRTYIERLRNDPRTRAMFDGWVAQATTLAEQRHPPLNERAARAAIHEAAREAIALAMSFVLDNDGEYLAVRAELETSLEHVIKLAELTPTKILVTDPAQLP